MRLHLGSREEMDRPQYPGEVRDTLGIPVAVENVSSYAEFHALGK